ISVGLRNVRVTVPTAVRKGDSAHLFCDYELEDKERLYSIKWYKGKREFYRYTPQEKPSMKVFTAVDVERSLSNESNVVIKALETNVSGKYSCEVSADAPSFHTMIVSGDMEVIEPPPEKPSITGLQSRYQPGDILRGNCTSINSKPPANLTWTINDVPIIPQYYKQYRPIKDTHTGLDTAILGINILVAHGHFIKGKLKLKCQATIHQIYDESSEWYVEEDRPRILATGSSSGHNLNQINQHTVYDGELPDQTDMYLTVNGYKADKSPTSSSSATQHVGAYVKVGWIAFYICTICTVLLYSLRVGIS
uniref:Ig-like domain-containing protein n=1 Tax=Anopheles epiroticus TaxID=199890 RepID=A0A182P4D2_9DIPT